MYLLRRTAFRALATPAKIFVKPRSFTTVPQISLRPKQQQWTTQAFQRRYASEDATKATLDTAEAAAAEAEDFAQTAAEAPIEDNLTPAQQSAQAPPTDKAVTAGIESLEAAAFGRRENSSKRRSEQSPAEPSKTVYVGNLYYEVTEDQLKRVFSRFGTVDSVKVVYDNRGLSRGFAYVEYQNPEEATVAIQNLDMQVFEGRNLVVQFHRPRKAPIRGNGEPLQANTPSKTLFIGNMSFEMSDKDLNDLFRDIRNVMDVRVAIDRRTGQPRGFAHADFVDVASATRAKEVLSEKVIYGRKLRIDFSKSVTQQQRERPQRSGDSE